MTQTPGTPTNTPTQPPAPKAATTQRSGPNHKKRLIILVAILVILGGVIFIGQGRNDDKMTSPKKGMEQDSYETTVTETVGLEIQGPATAQVGQEVTATINMDAGSDHVSGVEMRIAYPIDTFEVVSVKAGEALPVVLQGPIIEDGQIMMVMGSQPTAPQTGMFPIATVTLKPLKSGKGALEFTQMTRATATEYTDYLRAEPLDLTITVN